MSLDLVFFGTPELARVSLQAVLEAGHRVKAGVCQPDKPAGRGRRISSPPVAQACRIWEVDLLQPGSVRGPRFLDRIKALKPDLLVTVAYGRILPPELLEAPRIMPLNLHFSLLPGLRGAAPYNWALIRGLAETGVTTIRMVPQLDAGPILMQRPTPIDPQETAVDLAARLSCLGAELLVESLTGWKRAHSRPSPRTRPWSAWLHPLSPRTAGSILVGRLGKPMTGPGGSSPGPAPAWPTGKNGSRSLI